MNWSTKIRKWVRIIHRDLGYLLVGITLIYGVSGFLLNHMNGNDPAFKTTNAHLVFEPQLEKDALAKRWNSRNNLPQLKRVLNGPDGYLRLMLDSGTGLYNISSGEVDYQHYQQRPVIYYINRLHYNKADNWTPVADFFAFSPIFLAISGLFMVPNKNGLRGRGKWFLAAGILIPVIWIILDL